MFVMWVLARAPRTCFSSLCQLGFELSREKAGWGGRHSPLVVSFACLGKRWCPKYLLLCTDSPFRYQHPVLWEIVLPHSMVWVTCSLVRDANQFHPSCSDWCRDAPTSKAEPIRVFIWIHIWPSGKEVLPVALVNQEAVSARLCVAILSTLWRGYAW